MKDDDVERVARAIYEGRYASQGGVWACVETKDVWHDMARAALSAMPGRFYWLIERSAPREFFGFAEGAPIYVCLIYGKPWTDKADEALRFSRREDATLYWHRYEARDPALRIVEHGDIPALPERELLREALSALESIGNHPTQFVAVARAAADKIRAGIKEGEANG